MTKRYVAVETEIEDESSQRRLLDLADRASLTISQLSSNIKEMRRIVQSFLDEE